MQKFVLTIPCSLYAFPSPYSTIVSELSCLEAEMWMLLISLYVRQALCNKKLDLKFGFFEID